MSKEKLPILILSSIPAFTRNLVWAAGLSGRSCWVIDTQPDGIWRFDSNILGTHFIDPQELADGQDEVQRQVISFVRRHDIRDIVAADTRFVRLLMQLAPALPQGVRCFPMPESTRFEQIYDKSSFAELLDQLSLPKPRTRIVHSLKEINTLEMQFPVVVKPSQGEGGKGVHMCETLAALTEALGDTSDLRAKPGVVQAFIPGRDIGVSILADHGDSIAWTIHQRGPRGGINFVDRPDVLELAREFVSGVNYHGVINFDMRIDSRDETIVFIEANPRFWGSFPYSLWAGVNFLDLGLRHAHHEDVGQDFTPVTGDCPYLGVTRKSIFQILLGGWPAPRALDKRQRRIWRFHHRFGSGALRHWLSRWGPRLN